MIDQGYDHTIDVLAQALKTADGSAGPNDFRPLVIATEAVCCELRALTEAVEAATRLLEAMNEASSTQTQADRPRGFRRFDRTYPRRFRRANKRGT